MSLNPKSREQFAGDFIRTVKANSDITDVAQGSSTATYAEAQADMASEIQGGSLKLLESSNLSSLVGNDLDRKAESIRLPNGIGSYGRKPASQASGAIRIGSAFSKVSSKLYAGKPAPFAGSTTISLENAESFPATGQIYLGRNTVDRFEGPIAYTSVVNTGSFWQMTLATAITKSHLTSDLVVLAQGGDRVIQAGLTVQVPPANQQPATSFTTTETATIPDGEAEIDVPVVCTQFGGVGNALAGSIKRFTTPPFTGATVTNPTSFQSGRSTEADEDLRQRIRQHPSTLSRGTEVAIRAAIQGASDPETGRTIQSSVVLAPIEPGDSARVYIDDNTGLEPTFDVQPYELLLESATGQETRFRSAQYPITAAVAEGTQVGPFEIQDTWTLTVTLDEVTEIYTINPSNYRNLNAATAYELVRDLNSQANIVGFRTLDGGKRIVIIDLSGEGEILTVAASDLQAALGLPTAHLRPIFLYQNGAIQSFRGVTATLVTRARSQWSLTLADLQDVRVRVDGVIVTFTIDNSDFLEFGTNITTGTVTQWATVLGRKIPGVKFTVSGQLIIWSTRNVFSSTGSLEILEQRADGTPAGWIGDNKVWAPTTSGGTLAATGAEKDFALNRFTGEINFLEKPDDGTKIEIGSRSTRARIVSSVTPNGLFSLATIPGTVGNPRLVLAFDGDFVIRDVETPPAGTITPTHPDPSGATNLIRLTANSTMLANALPGDYLYLVRDISVVPTWNADIETAYPVRAVGLNQYESNQTYLGLAAAALIKTSLVAFTTLDSLWVRIIQADHGLRTGDLVTVYSQGSAVGGISAGNLQQANTPVVVLDDDNFLYQAGASATSSVGGTIDNMGTNVITVTHSSHGFSSGATINTTVGAGFAGISAGNLSVTGAPIEVTGSNAYRYRALAAATTPGGGTVNTLVYVADCWIEIEVSNLMLLYWTPLLATPQALADGMINLFRCTGAVPQVVDFGASFASAEVDDVIDSINDQIAAGTAVKESPQQISVRSNDYEAGTCAVLVAIGSAANLFEPGVASSIQPHQAYSGSGQTGAGAPVITGQVLPTTGGYATRTYLEMERSILHITSTAADPAVAVPVAWTPDYPRGFNHLFITGRQYGLTARVYNNQTASPYIGIISGDDAIRPLKYEHSEQTNPATLNRYYGFGLRFHDVPLNENDKFVVEMDLDPTDRTVAIQMHKKAKIQDIDAITGSGAGQVISFRLKDPEDSDKPFFDPTSVYKAYDFTDFRLMVKSVGLYREDPLTDRGLVLRTIAYGSQNQLTFQIRYPETPDQATVVVNHTNTFEEVARLNLIAFLPSSTTIVGSTLTSGAYQVDATASATLFDWRVTGGTVNQAAVYAPGDVLNFGAGQLAGSFRITGATYAAYVGVTIDTTNLSPTILVTQAAHGYLDGDLINVTTTAAVGGISAAALSGDFVINVLSASQFEYTALASATSTVTGSVDTISGGSVTVKAPGSGGVLTPQMFDAASIPLAAWSILPATWQDIADAINDYLPDNPMVTAEVLGTNIPSNPVVEATYETYPPAAAYAGTDIEGAFSHAAFEAKLSGEAGIWQYDSSNAGLNNIKATVQTDDSIFPTTTEAMGTTYSPINEEVIVVPTNSKTIRSWLDFNAASSLNILATIERVANDQDIQIASRTDGSLGAVAITGVAANRLLMFLQGNSTELGESTVVPVLSAEAKAVNRDSFVRVRNDLATEIPRTYRLDPVGAALTTHNQDDIISYFRTTNAVKYVRVNANTGRLVFYRYGMGPGQTEPLQSLNEITLTNLGDGLVQVTSDIATGPVGSGKLAARTGDMMYVLPGGPFAVDVECAEAPTTGVTPGDAPDYRGYPVVEVIDDENVIIIAPNITSFGTTPLTGTTQLVFMPAIWNEKNIRSNYAAGPQFHLPQRLLNSGRLHAVVKQLGSGLVSVHVRNSTTYAADDLQLDQCSVSTDDYAVFGTGFDPANQGSYRIVAHDGKNHMVIFNPAGGKDEIVDASVNLTSGGMGSRKYGVGPLVDGGTRPVRVVDADSVRIGDLLRISTAAGNTQWFPPDLIGSFVVTSIGLHAFDYSGALPHSPGVGTPNAAHICPYIEFTIANAPVAVLDTNGDPVDVFLLDNNNVSIGFIEAQPLDVLRKVAGHAVSPTDFELQELFLVPARQSQKMTSIFGTNVEVMFKMGFTQQTFQGIDGYKVYSGLVREAHRIIDGLPTNTILFPGVKAAGTSVEVLPPLIRAIQIDLQVRPKDGVTLNSITEIVKATVANYVNGLDVGAPVVLSEIVSAVQRLPGVFSVKILNTLPAADDDRIVSAVQEKSRILDVNKDVTVG